MTNRLKQGRGAPRPCKWDNRYRAIVTLSCNTRLPAFIFTMYIPAAAQRYKIYFDFYPKSIIL
jgi:hypothetical protein